MKCALYQTETGAEKKFLWRVSVTERKKIFLGFSRQLSAYYDAKCPVFFYKSVLEPAERCYGIFRAVLLAEFLTFRGYELASVVL
jgi:hypothetical protein